MKPASKTQHPASGFTLIELLVVISVIGILAALTFPAIGAAKLAILRGRARTELQAMTSAIESYNHKVGYYPPDNPNDWKLNQLYYELLGTTNVTIGGAPSFQTLDGSAQIRVADLPTVFSANVTTIMNCTRGSGADEVANAVAFLSNLKSGQFLAITNPSVPTPVTVLGAGIDGPEMLQSTSGLKINPWRYNSSSPRYNLKSYDLWIDVIAGSKTNRICNWNDKYIIVGAPY